MQPLLVSSPPENVTEIKLSNLLFFDLTKKSRVILARKCYYIKRNREHDNTVIVVMNTVIVSLGAYKTNKILKMVGYKPMETHYSLRYNYHF